MAMTESEFTQFSQLVSAVAEVYGKPTTKYALALWWGVLRQYDLPAVKRALDRHVRNTDGGHFMPKPADVIRMIQGSTEDASLVAWAKVDNAVRVIGPHQTVVFDDALIHRVLNDMGGWVAMGGKVDKDWPFIGKEFQTRYRGYKLQGTVPEFPSMLVGIADATNRQQGFAPQSPVLVGNGAAARQVMMAGRAGPLVAFERLDAEELRALTAPQRIAA